MQDPLSNPNENQYYSSGQNNIYNCQGQSSQEALLPTEPNYYPPPQNNPQNQYYKPPQNPNTPAQPVASVASPLQGNIPVGTSVQQGIPVNNYPQTGEVPQPAIQYDDTYQQYKKFSQISHKGIYPVDENTIYISTGCCFKAFPFIFALFGLIFVGLGIFTRNVIPGVAGALFTCIGICMLFTLFNSIYFIMGPNTLTIMRKATCRTKNKMYNPGELQRIEFTHRYTRDFGEKHKTHKYKLTVIPTNGEADNIFQVGSSSRVFTEEEMDYFLDYINTHIRIKMRV